MRMNVIMFQRSWGLPTWASKYPQASPSLASLHGASSRGPPRIHSSLESLRCSRASQTSPGPPSRRDILHTCSRTQRSGPIQGFFRRLKLLTPPRLPPSTPPTASQTSPGPPIQEAHFAYLFEKGMSWTDMRIFFP